MSVMQFKPFDRAQDLSSVDYRPRLAVIGNGNTFKGMEMWDKVTLRLRDARQKHPLFAKDVTEALEAISDEYQELVDAIDHESPARQEDEVLDVIVTCLRFLGGEHKSDAVKTK